jgi:hypothetical protein
MQEDGWVVCRVFKKKNLFKVGNDVGSNISNNRLEARSFIRRESPYQGISMFELNKPEEISVHQYPQPPMFQPHHKPLSIGYDYSLALLPRESEYQQACQPSGVEVGTCKAVSEWGIVNCNMVSHEDSSRAMRFEDDGNNTSSTVQPPSNLLSLRGENGFLGLF